MLPRLDYEFWMADPAPGLGELLMDDAVRAWLRAVPRAVLPAVRERLDLVELDTEVVPATLAMAYHFPFPGIGRVAKDAEAGAWRWAPGQ